jgi:hypothetical protein
MLAMRMTAERETSVRETSEMMAVERMASARVVTDVVEEEVGPLQRKVVPTEGIGWVGMTVEVWMAAVWMTAKVWIAAVCMATAAVACRMKEALAGGLFLRPHLLAAQLRNDVSLSVWLGARLAVAILLQLGHRLRLLEQ